MMFTCVYSNTSHVSVLILFQASVVQAQLAKKQKKKKKKEAKRLAAAAADGENAADTTTNGPAEETSEQTPGGKKKKKKRKAEDAENGKTGCIQEFVTGVLWKPPCQ